MNQEQIKVAQDKFVEMQKGISSTVVSSDNNVKVTVDGNLQIIELFISKNPSDEALVEIIKDTINKSIKDASLQIQTAVSLMQQQFSIK